MFKKIMAFLSVERRLTQAFIVEFNKLRDGLNDLNIATAERLRKQDSTIDSYKSSLHGRLTRLEVLLEDELKKKEIERDKRVREAIKKYETGHGDS